MVDESHVVEVFDVRSPHHMRRCVVEQGNGAKLGHYILPPERLGEDPDVESRSNVVWLVRREVRCPVGDICGVIAERGEVCRQLRLECGVIRELQSQRR